MMLPLGRYGYTNFSQTPLKNKVWGTLGAAGVIPYPCVMGYLFYRISCFSISIFYNRVILQERNWMQEYNKFNLPHGNYNFKDTGLSQDMYMSRDAKVEMKSSSTLFFSAVGWSLGGTGSINR